jgi:hypothetical protein
LTLDTGDLNADGALDWIATVFSDSPVYGTPGFVDLGMGDGNGGVAAHYALTLTNVAVRGSAIGDFNGDGNLDLVAHGYRLSDYMPQVGYKLFPVLTQYHGSGLGTFLPAGETSSSSLILYGIYVDQYTRTHAMDVDNNGTLDVLVDPNTGAKPGYDQATICLNDQSTFLPPITLSTSGDFRSTVMADVNKDGTQDILAGNDGYGNLSTL